MSRHQARSRTAQLTHGLAALATLLILLAGLPAALVIVAGSPLPHTAPTWPQITAALTQPDTGNTLFLAVIKMIAWTAWLCFTTATLTETIGYLRGRPIRHMPGPIRPLQHLARTLITAVALLAGTAGPFTGTAASNTGHIAARSIQTAETTEPVAHTEPLTRHHASKAAPEHRAEPRRWRTRVIRRGDTLWTIAHHTLGSGTRYLKIFSASRHLHQPHGLPPVRDPNRIFPGQRITIPPPPAAPSRHPRPRPPRHAPPPEQAPVIPPGLVVPSAPATPEPPKATTPQPASPALPSATRSQVTPTPNPPAHPEPAPSSTASTATRTPADTPRSASPGSGEQHRREPVTVTLPSGAYLGLGLAGAISVALATTRLHRRRRRRLPKWRESRPRTGTGAAPPEPVAKARKAHMDTYTDAGEPVPSDAELVAGDLTTPAPTHLTVGVREGRDLTVALSGLNLALTGPGAIGVARAIVTELLAKSHRYRVDVIIPAPDATTIFAGTGVTAADLAAAVPGLIVTPSLAAAITRMETEFIHRARLMEATDQGDVPALRNSDPGEPLPAIVLIASAPESSEGLQAILRLGQPYCVGGLLLGAWPAGTTLDTAADGTITRPHGPDTDTWTGGRLFHLTAPDTAAMLKIVQTAGGAPEPDPPHASAPDGAKTPEDQPAQPEDREQRTEPVSPPPGPAQEETPRPVRLRVLGAVRVDADGKPITTGLRRITRELLAYLALHPDGITREQGIDALMPERDLAAGTTMFHTAINNTRKTLRAATGLREPMFITYTQGRYRLDPHLIDVDLWDLNHTLDQAQRAADPAGRIQALRGVVELYMGELADDLTYEWAETEREQIRRHATDALAHLAELTHHDHPDQALTALETAITHDPYAEALYQQLMRLQARLDRPDAVRRSYQLLKTRLADLDTDPSNETDQLLHELLRPPGVRKPTTPPPGPSSKRSPRPRANRTGTVHTLRPRNQP